MPNSSPRRAAIAVIVGIAVGGAAACSSSSGDPQTDALCNLLDTNKRVAPDQLARQVYGSGRFDVAADGIRKACVDRHGAVANYLDDTANYDGSYELKIPPGYGTESS